MGKNMPEGLMSQLQSLFGDRVRFNQVEMISYSHDMGVLPSQVLKLIDNLPESVAQPVSDQELSSVIKLANEYKWPVVPRGSGTSGFGGALPTRGGIVLDLVRMNKIIALNEKDLTVTVEPAVIWGDLQQYLQSQGYSLRLYPSSAPSATVAGWVAQGGSGYGSYQYGFCAENIVKVDMILPDGSSQSFTGNKLNFVNGMCGITGIISQVTLKINKFQEETPILAAFDNLSDATAALNAIKNLNMQLWSVSMSTPSYVKLRQDISGHRILSEDHYYLTIVHTEDIKSTLNQDLEQIIAMNSGKTEAGHLAAEEWAERFFPMRFKKLGPSLIASEIIVPLDKLPAFVCEVEKKYKGEFALEGTMIHHDKMAVLGFMLADERKLGFPMAYASSLTVIAIGEKMGGRVPSLGLYFADKAKDVLGDQLTNEIWDYKKQIDPQGIINPGKVIPSSLDIKSPAKMMSKAMALANTGKSVIGVVGKIVDRVQSGDNFSSPLSEEMTHDAFSCALCGYCRNVCTVFDAAPWESQSPRGKYYLLTQYIKGNIKMDEDLGRALYACTTCKKCDEVCQIKAHNAHNWMSLRPCFHANGLENTGLAGIRENVLNTGNFWGVPAADKFNWLDVPTLKKGKIGFWAGCWANVVMPNMPQNVTRILHRAGQDLVHFGEGETCCGLYLNLGGYMDDFNQQIKKNLATFKEAGVETVICTCPGCYATFTENYLAIAEEMGMKLEFKHIVAFLSELVNEGKLQFTQPLKQKITYHDSCHVGRWFGLYDEPRTVIKAIPGVELVEMEHNRKEALCCGLVAAFDSLPTAGHAGMKRVAEAEGTGADFIITNCAGCGSQFNATSCAMQTNIRQKDLSELVAEAMGLEVQDPSQNIAAYMGAVGQILADSALIKTANKDKK